MDRKQLETHLQLFKKTCSQKGKPLADMCLFEAYPGDASTSYRIEVKAAWIDEMDCSDAIDFLYGVLWETADEEIRKHVFSIEILDINDVPHCSSPSPQEYGSNISLEELD